MKMKTIKQGEIRAGAIVLVRVDYNIALDSRGKVVKDELFRIARTMPTIRYLISKRARVVLLAHLGRPGGKINKKYSNKPIALALGKILGKPVKMLPGVIEKKIKQQIDELKPGQVVLLENLRFYPGEDKNDKKFAQNLAALGDIYVNDAFANIHRQAASMLAITEYLPSFAGLLLEEEISRLTSLILKAEKPLVFVVGGAKVETKIRFIKKLLPQASKILIGGVLANTILKGNMDNISLSVYDKALVEKSKGLYKNKKVVLPKDVICDNIKTTRIEAMQKNLNEIEKNDRIIDIGTLTAVDFSTEIRKAKTVFFNGPLGLMEKSAGRHGSQAIAEIIAALSASKKIKSIVGGGETIGLFSSLGIINDITYVSTGGGALFAFLIDQKMPSLKPLLKKL